ncbi:hypothetical protein HNR23_004182 [Nocardiopsis mwathae]|uniref:Short-chain dehydrogenase n=1 Tax=Nocardiopsis mwathae TaxID=1472723 RepID=A0A7X0D709_9ACTN|nr:SDR family oxidoreductase [Nocardiopsis mwathae]MBB6174122.1 hypothetical protein [Nocardiopsis mwathae]
MTASRSSRTALVTGASTGIGEEYARKLAERGYAVVLVARRAEELERIAAELRERYGVDAVPLAADLGEDSGLAAVEERLRADGTGADAPVDLLVNNAGRGEGGTFTEMDPAAVDSMLDLNVRAVLRLTRAVLPVQIARGRADGRGAPLGVINVSSVAGELAVNPHGSVYAGTKKFVTLWSESVALEVAEHGVHVTAVLPGFVRTDMTRSVQEKGLPDIAWVPRERIVRESLRAWAAGYTKVVPGAQYKAAVNLLRVIPRSVFKSMARRLG